MGSSAYAADNSGSWDPKRWAWDSIMFVAKPALGGASGVSPAPEKKKEGDEYLALKLGGGSLSVDESAARASKRVRSGSPGTSGNYPTCQVDDCRVDLSSTKDYHRRHKVCEEHSKSTKAFVGNQMQRFCQQCSRFHPLSEFDEGKRSCRRRLAGHNRRRRKIQPEDTLSRVLLPGSIDGHGDGNLEVVKILSMLALLQGKGMEPAINSSIARDKDQLIKIVREKNFIPDINSTSKASTPAGFDLNMVQYNQSFQQIIPGGFEQMSDGSQRMSAPSTLDLLAVLSAASKDSSSNDVIGHGSCESSGIGKVLLNSPDPSFDTSPYKNVNVESGHLGFERGNHALQESLEAIDHPLQDSRLTLSLQLFDTIEDDSPVKLNPSRKCLYPSSSNPVMESSSSPCNEQHEKTQSCIYDIAMDKGNTTTGLNSAFHLSNNSEDKRVENTRHQILPHQDGRSCSSVSNHSSSSNHDAHDQTNRIIFKLSERNPSDIPGSLRTQILDWLSHCPLEMESYIRPGCVVLSVYLSMPSKSWNKLQEDLLHRVHLLAQYADSDFLRTGTFHIRMDQKLAAYSDGKVHICKSWETWSSPELMSVTPLAVVSGKKTLLVLKGRNLALPGTRIHCTYMGGYISKDVLGSAPDAQYDPGQESFLFPEGPPNIFGRCFIEVENGFKGNCFPVIIADDVICQELRDLESEIENIENIAEHDQKPHSREDVVHFLNELGWLFQRTRFPSILCLKDFSCPRFKFLLEFAVERDWLALVKKLLDMLVERSSGGDEFISDMQALSEIQLLSQAVRRKCRKMVDFLLHYSIDNVFNTSIVYIFTPNHMGPARRTPLHLAASMQESEDIVDALTNDPQKIALDCWNSLMDDNGQTPFAYAAGSNNHPYNNLVSRKLADRRNGQLSITIENNGISLHQSYIEIEPEQPGSVPSRSRTCAECAVLERRKLIGNVRSKGLLSQPFINCMLAVGAVCVCVCLFLRGKPQFGTIEPFMWENLGYGPR